MARKNSLFEQVLVSSNTHLMVVDFYDVDKRPEVRLPEGHRSDAEALTHDTAKTLDQPWIDLDLSS